MPHHSERDEEHETRLIVGGGYAKETLAKRKRLFNDFIRFAQSTDPALNEENRLTRINIISSRLKGKILLIFGTKKFPHMGISVN